MTVLENDLGTAMSRISPFLVQGLPELFTDLRLHLADIDPGYADFVDGPGDLAMTTARAAIELLIATAGRILSGGTAEEVGSSEDEGAMFEEIGRIQCREGIPVGTLLSAYQMCARVGWRHMSTIALREGLPPDALAALAEAIFCFVDRLSSASAAGYLAEQAESAAVRERSRDELAGLLLSDRSNMQAVRTAAARAAWPVPDTAALVFVEGRNEVGRDMVSRLDPLCLAVRTASLFGAIVPDPDLPGRRQRFADRLRGSGAVIGRAVPLSELPASVGIAEVAARLQRDGILTDDPVFVDEHMDAIIVHRDAVLLEALRAQCLAPLDDAPAASRNALRDTLRSWLENLGDRRAIAADLHIHPQTVRYRLARLRELFGDSMDDVHFRVQLGLVLCWGPVS